MELITTTEDLARFCAQAQAAPYVTVDTEFLRERTYYAKLCLLQMALPGPEGPETGPAVLVDPLAKGLSLEPFYELLRDTSTVKVLHAARQDLEIFLIEGRSLPKPLFDTQIAAMVCGFGDQIGYETLVRKLTRGSVDKSSRFTDWSRRPLTDAQLGYALADVTHLRVIYEKLAARLEETGRASWVAEELATLDDPATYITQPADAWKRVKTRNDSGRFLAIVRELAEFREAHAQSNNVPRSRVFKDDALLELASLKPQTPDDLGRTRLLLREARKGEIAQGILDAVARGMTCPPENFPKPENGRENLQVNPALADLLRVLLKAKSDATGVAAKLIASASDLDALAAGVRDVPALSGWRAAVFGDDALSLCNGEVGLAVRGERVEVMAVPR
ncbi:ribonuclease D [Roseinatronobacter bogoriensis]|uniref:Ribonuclease D n=1 Tax=Roseinatronobacter bogoriensis subsp. barguzinensis TaxID=441209 RepID=A0A2K8K5K0_9RHOB|nr:MULTISPECIES: ribonuclease D [Rhodobaca]ATX64732.1 ribonuclease D [Rhodobaca barguzinensis]MBB4208511.1 ribonuclease D [Rhodobaca bogoriensis DSM 18756]TDW38220.1 ribonuclease D [Rhodobaca barguzinensis]TDY69609.1 ribonuclease D [Rhodobaca bogoriensis DSM 18756]